MLGIGAMAKSVRDAQLINDIIAHTQPEERNLEEFTLVIPEQALGYLIDEATATALKAFVTTCRVLFLVDEQPPISGNPRYCGSVSCPLRSLCIWPDSLQPSSCTSFARILKRKCFKSSELHHYFTWVLVGANLTKPSQKALHRTQHTIDQEISR